MLRRRAFPRVKTIRRVVAVLFVGLLAFGLYTVLRDQDWAPLVQLIATLAPPTSSVDLVGGVSDRALASACCSAWCRLAGTVLDLGARVDTWTALRIFFVGFLISSCRPVRGPAGPASMGRQVDVGPVRLASGFVLSSEHRRADRADVGIGPDPPWSGWAWAG